jgi:hypothetical protein
MWGGDLVRREVGESRGRGARIKRRLAIMKVYEGERASEAARIL